MVMRRADQLMERLESRGLAYVDELIDSAKGEEAFLEYKSSNTDGGPLSNDDRKHFGRALSGFANSDGGVVLWGVGTKKPDRRTAVEKPVRGKEVPDCRLLASLLEDCVSGLTVPPVPGVRSHPIPIDGGPRGYVATLIPASTVGSHQVANCKAYLVRTGASFQPVHHSVLAGMFGRRPAPALDLRVEYHPLVVSSSKDRLLVQLDVCLRNTSGVVARDHYVSWECDSTGGSKCRISPRSAGNSRFSADLAPSGLLGCWLAESGNRLAPLGVQSVGSLIVSLKPQITSSLAVTITFGCEGAPPFQRRIHVPRPTLELGVSEALVIATRGDKAADWLEEARLVLGQSSPEAAGNDWLVGSASQRRARRAAK